MRRLDLPRKFSIFFSVCKITPPAELIWRGPTGRTRCPGSGSGPGSCSCGNIPSCRRIWVCRETTPGPRHILHFPSYFIFVSSLWFGPHSFHLIFVSNVKCWVDPAIIIEYFARHPGACLAIYWVSEILFRHPDQTWPDEYCDRDPVVEFKHNIVDGQVINFEDGLGGSEDVKRHDPVSASVLVPGWNQTEAGDYTSWVSDIRLWPPTLGVMRVVTCYL